MTRRLIVVLALGLWACPAVAIAKQGAMFSPQLLALPAGRSVRVELFVLPVYRGGREAVAAPRVGSVPVVGVRLLPSRRVLQFSGTPLDRDHRSRVSIGLPASAAAETWTVSVKADGRVYRDDIDLGSVTPPTAPVLWALARWSWQARSRRMSERT